MSSNNLTTYAAVMGVIFLIEGISHSVSCTSTSSTGLFYRPDKLYTAPGPGKRALLDSDEDAQQQQQRVDGYNAIVRSLMQRLPKYLPIHWFAFKSTTKKSSVYEQQQQQSAPSGIILLKDVQQADRSSSRSSNDDETNNNNSGGGGDGVGELSSDDLFKAENMVSFF